MQAVPGDMDMDIDGEDSENDEADTRQTRKSCRMDSKKGSHPHVIEKTRLERMGIFS